MINPPVLDQTVTSEQLDLLFVEHDFDSLLAACDQIIPLTDRYYPDGHPSHPRTMHKHGTKYRLAGVTIAVIFHYTHNDKTVTRHIRILRVGDTRFSVARLPPVHPQNE